MLYDSDCDSGDFLVGTLHYVLIIKITDLEELRKRIVDINSFLKEQSTTITDYNEPLIQWLIKKLPFSGTGSSWNSSPA